MKMCVWYGRAGGDNDCRYAHRPVDDDMIIFADIDGTMRDYQLGFLPSSAAALDEAAKNGHTLMLCTGRTVGMIPYDVPLDKFDGMICGGGCHLSYKGEVFKDLYIEDSIMMRYRRFFEEQGVPYALETYQGIFMAREMGELMAVELFRTNDPASADAVGLRTERIDVSRRLAEFDERGLSASKISFCLTPEQYRSFVVSDEDRLTLIVFPRSADGYYHCEMVRSGCDKGTAIKEMVRHIGADMADTLAVGDSMNDADAFRAAARALCMGNGSEDIKALADMVSAPCAEDGFYKGLKMMGLK